MFKRAIENPILKPSSIHPWDAEGAFNGCPVRKDDKIYLAYRAMSVSQYHTMAETNLKVSSVGIAESKDGLNFYKRKLFFSPENEWERFGCEDPRITEFEGKYYIFYTAISTYPFSAQGIKVGVAISSDLETIDEKHPVTPFNAKAMTLFPQRINGKIVAMLTVNTDLPDSKICLAQFDKIEDLWDEVYWQKWYQSRDEFELKLLRHPEDRIEVGSPPIETGEGWLFFYSYIDNYFSSEPLFTVEAALLDKNNPLEIISRSKSPLLTPEEYYEKIGIVPNIIFPSGALINGDYIYLYYGGADTVTCQASIKTVSLLDRLTSKTPLIKFERFSGNPIIEPIKEHIWEAKATFNPGAIYLNNKVHLVYRAMSEDNTSVFGYATSSDGLNIDYRSDKPVFEPSSPSEEKEIPWGNSGCEDPRLTQIDDRIYMLYTSFNGKNPPRISITWISTADFLGQNWRWTESKLISPPNIDDKDACLFPEKIKNRYFIIHRYGNDIDSDFVHDLDFDGKTWLEEYKWVSPRPGMWDSEKVGIAAPPIKTNRGYILFYHGVSKDDHSYRVGALLLDPQDPTQILFRSDDPLLEPKEDFEIKGQTPNVVFPCGAVQIKDTIYIYYGGADSKIGVASIQTEKLINYLTRKF